MKIHLLVFVHLFFIFLVIVILIGLINHLRLILREVAIAVLDAVGQAERKSSALVRERVLEKNGLVLQGAHDRAIFEALLHDNRCQQALHRL